MKISLSIKLDIVEKFIRLCDVEKIDCSQKLQELMEAEIKKNESQTNDVRDPNTIDWLKGD